MAKVVRGVDDYKKEFLSIFNSLCGRHGRWEVWSDFIQLTAIDISNVTDKGNAPKRAADARNIAKKYSEDEIKRMAEMLMQMVYAIDENPDQDFLGELYINVIFAAARYSTRRFCLPSLWTGTTPCMRGAKPWMSARSAWPLSVRRSANCKKLPRVRNACRDRAGGRRRSRSAGRQGGYMQPVGAVRQCPGLQGARGQKASCRTDRAA